MEDQINDFINIGEMDKAMQDIKNSLLVICLTGSIAMVIGYPHFNIQYI